MLTFHQGYLAYSWPLIPKEKHIMKEMKPTEGVKKRGLFPSFLINRPQWAESQWTNPKLLEYEQQQSSWAQIPVCVWLAKQQILNIIESLQRPGLRGFEIWYSWWKLCRKKKKKNTGGLEGGASNASSLLAEINLVLSDRQSISMAIREKGLELKSKHQRGSQSLAESPTFKIHFLELISFA